MNWEEIYRQRTMTADEVIENIIQNGDDVYAGGQQSANQIMDALLSACQREERTGITLHGNFMEPTLEFPKLPPEVFRYHCFFQGPSERAGAKVGTVTYVPLHFSQYGMYMEHVSPDVAIIPMTPPDENGYCNIGPLGYHPTALKFSKKIVAEIKPGLPRVKGSYHDFHVSQIEAFVKGEGGFPPVAETKPSEIDQKISSYIVERIVDGSCIQLGIGGMANAVGFGLKDKKHLGVHSEMYTESMAYLQQLGVVDNSRKKSYPGVSIGGFALGSQKYYDYISNNPEVYFMPYEVINNLNNIAENDNVVSVNSAMAVDLSGQISAESVGFRQFSGSGGHSDFIRGALYSKGGQSFIALPSTYTAKDGTMHSKISLDFPPGSTVTSLRAEVQHIVTEYGCATLRYCDIPTRAKRMIEIAHPAFREQLTFDAKKAGLIY